MPPTFAQPSLPRRLAASGVDAFVLFVVPILWWHWSEWARYTTTFGRRVPWEVAMPVMALMPLTVLWLEAVTGRGAGKGLAGLRVADRAGGPASLGRRLLRAALKWSPAWVGPAVWIVDAYTNGTRADDFTNDHLLTITTGLTERLPPLKPLMAGVGVSLRGMNWGVFPLALLAAGYLLVLLPGRRTLLDRVCGTRVVR